MEGWYWKVCHRNGIWERKVDSSSTRQAAGTCFCKCRHEISGYIKGRNFFLTNCRIFSFSGRNMLDTKRHYTLFFPVYPPLSFCRTPPPRPSSLLNYTENHHGVYPPNDNTGVTPENENDLCMPKFIWNVKTFTSKVLVTKIRFKFLTIFIENTAFSLHTCTSLT